MTPSDDHSRCCGIVCKGDLRQASQGAKYEREIEISKVIEVLAVSLIQLSSTSRRITQSRRQQNSIISRRLGRGNQEHTTVDFSHVNK